MHEFSCTKGPGVAPVAFVLGPVRPNHRPVAVAKAPSPLADVDSSLLVGEVGVLLGRAAAGGLQGLLDLAAGKIEVVGPRLTHQVLVELAHRVAVPQSFQFRHVGLQDLVGLLLQWGLHLLHYFLVNWYLFSGPVLSSFRGLWRGCNLDMLLLPCY